METVCRACDTQLERDVALMDVINAPGPFSGTPAYMAPEQLAGGSVDVRTDVNGVAVLLHRLVMGELPYPCPAMPAHFLDRTDPVGDPPPRATCSRMDVELAAICRRALSDNPGLRQASAKEFAEDPEEVFSEFPETRERRNRLITWAAALSAAWSLLRVVPNSSRRDIFRDGTSIRRNMC